MRGIQYDNVALAGSVSTQFNGVLLSAVSLYLLVVAGPFIWLATYLIYSLIQNQKHD